MLVTGREFIFVRTQTCMYWEIFNIVWTLCEGKLDEAYELNVYREIDSMQTLYDKLMEVYSHKEILGIIKVEYDSPASYMYHELDEEFTKFLLEKYEDEIWTFDEMSDDMPSFCWYTEAYNEARDAYLDSLYEDKVFGSYEKQHKLTATELL